MKYNSKKKVTRFVTTLLFGNCFYLIEVCCKFESHECDDEIYL